MSTTFSVYPQTLEFPTFRQVVAQTTTRLHTFLEQHGITQPLTLDLRLLSKEGYHPQPLDWDAPATWPDDYYAWVSVPPIPGGTDGYFWALDAVDREYWDERLLLHPWPDEARQQWIQACLASGYRWRFRRSAGQSATINLVYGFLAAALAELTGGFLYSGDSAWDYQRFPATSAEFYNWYFEPQQALDADHARWAARCIAAISKELASGNAWPE